MNVPPGPGLFHVHSGNGNAVVLLSCVNKGALLMMMLKHYDGGIISAVMVMSEAPSRCRQKCCDDGNTFKNEYIRLLVL